MSIRLSGEVIRVLKDVNSEDHRFVTLAVDEVSAVTQPAILQEEEVERGVGVPVVKLETINPPIPEKTMKALTLQEGEDAFKAIDLLVKTARVSMLAATGEEHSYYFWPVKLFDDHIVMGNPWSDPLTDDPEKAAVAYKCYYERGTDGAFKVTRVVPVKFQLVDGGEVGSSAKTMTADGDLQTGGKTQESQQPVAQETGTIPAAEQTDTTPPASPVAAAEKMDRGAMEGAMGCPPSTQSAEAHGVAASESAGPHHENMPGGGAPAMKGLHTISDLILALKDSGKSFAVTVGPDGSMTVKGEALAPPPVSAELTAMKDQIAQMAATQKNLETELAAAKAVAKSTTITPAAAEATQASAPTYETSATQTRKGLPDDSPAFGLFTPAIVPHVVRAIQGQ